MNRMENVTLDKNNPDFHTDIPRLRKGGVGAQVSGLESKRLPKLHTRLGDKGHNDGLLALHWAKGVNVNLRCCDANFCPFLFATVVTGQKRNLDLSQRIAKENDCFCY